MERVEIMNSVYNRRETENFFLKLGYNFDVDQGILCGKTNSIVLVFGDKNLGDLVINMTRLGITKGVVSEGGRIIIYNLVKPYKLGETLDIRSCVDMIGLFYLNCDLNSRQGYCLRKKLEG